MTPGSLLDVRDQPEGATLRVRVKPRASRDGIAGAREGALVVGVCAAARDGAANEALVRLLARAARVPPSAVTILRGAAGRDKLLRFLGVSATDLLGRLVPPHA